MMRKHFLLFVLLPLCSHAVVHAQWEPDVRLTFADSVSGTPWNNAWSVAASGDTVHVVWWDKRDGDFEIYTKRSTDGGAVWGPDIRLTQAPDTSWLPSVSASGSFVHAVWMDKRDGNQEIYYKRSTDAGALWGQDTRLTSEPADSWFPSMAVWGQRVHVVWCDFRDGPSNLEIYTKRSTDGGATWEPDVRLTYHPSYSWHPSVAVTGADVQVAWQDDRDGNLEIYHKRSTDGGTTWGPDVRLTSDTASSSDPSLAVSGPEVHVVWMDERDGNREVYYKRSTDRGTNWGPDVRLTQAPWLSELPVVAASGGQVHIVWVDLRDSNYEIYYKRSTDGGAAWSPDTRLTNSSGYSDGPFIAHSGSKLHVVWCDNREGNYEIFYKRNPTGNIGVQETGNASPVTRLPFSVHPNPFKSFATVVGQKTERFVLYDITGRKVGTYKGDRIGEGLSPGVYFLKPEGQGGKSLRVVKIR